MEKEIKIQVPKGYEIDKEKSTFEKIVFKKKPIVNCYEELPKVDGVYISTDSIIRNLGNCENDANNYNKNVYLNTKYAKSALALAQISQLLPYYDTDVDWNIDKWKWSIIKVHNKIKIECWQYTYHLLSFNTREETEKFLKYNEQLVKDYLMID